jgi:hypothetical protein
MAYEQRGRRDYGGQDGGGEREGGHEAGFVRGRGRSKFRFCFLCQYFQTIAEPPC